jgi:hypothetical protein
MTYFEILEYIDKIIRKEMNEKLSKILQKKKCGMLSNHFKKVNLQ